MTVDTETLSGSISEPAFLMTELRYTLGQIHVQLGDLDRESRGAMMCGNRSALDVVQEMMEEETRYQNTYARLLNIPSASHDPEENEIPLPVREEEDASGAQPEFEHLRARTLSLLDQASEPWSPELLRTVKEHVARDRQQTTDLAECRRQFFERPQRPDLQKPLEAAEHKDNVADHSARVGDSEPR